MNRQISRRISRKTATRLLLVQWSRFQNICIRLEGSTLFTGVNGSGKSTILDAMTYLLTGNTQFNKAARDRDRTVLAYVRGDTRSNGDKRYLRTGEVVSYIAMEFWSPLEQESLVVGVCIESPNETLQKGSWFICRGASIEDMNFARVENGILKITPRGELAVNGTALRPSDFFSRDRGVEQLLRALGLRCNAAKYRSKLVKMMAFNPENNIDQFIQECVLEAGTVESLGELREQRSQFERIRAIYENLKNSRRKLEEVERRSAEYESRLRSFQIRELMLCYQDLMERKEEEKEVRLKIEALKHRQKTLEDRRAELDAQYEAAGERYRIAENNNIFRGMTESLQALERQSADLDRDIEKHESRLSKVLRLQMQIAELMRWMKEFFSVSEQDQKVLSALASESDNPDEKIRVFLRFASMVRQQDEILEADGVHFKDEAAELDRQIEELDGRIRALKANRLVFPKDVQRAKKIISEEFKRQGIRTEVRVFAELVSGIADAGWRAAIETFLGKKRYYIIVDGKYCHKAMEILRDKKIYKANVVITDKLPDTEIKAGSASAMLEVPNVFARRYANYLLNGIHLCETLEELHEYPRGGLMKNGMLAKGYAAACMDIGKTEFCLGADAIRHQLERAEQERAELAAKRGLIREKMDQNRRKRSEIAAIDWREENYDFFAADRLAEAQQKRESVAANIREIRENPDFMMILQERENARNEYEQIKRRRDDVVRDIGTCGSEMSAAQEILKTLSGSIFMLTRDYEEKCQEHAELRRPMLEEYEKLREKKGSVQVVTMRMVANLRGEVAESVSRLENAQLEYCRLAEMDLTRRGTAYIPFYREQYRNIANIKIEEAHQKLEEQALKLESAFMNDFVAEINETVREAKAEIDSINRELKQIPFGNDTYKFIMKEKPDRSVFFRICRKLENYMNSPEVYMNSARDDEEMEHDIQEFMEMILDEEDEAQYTDYRKYFSYDMEIVSRQGNDEVVADLSKKQGSASNGEKQTPYFIILAASLLQCYPRNVCCARLAFIDEAFSALSRERIEQMVKYLEENQFQVIYAAPPEKISSIGSFIQSTVSLVMTGRYTNAVEGLVKGETV